MAAMKELVPEYRAASAKLAMRISEKKAAGASPAELRPLQEALRDVREVKALGRLLRGPPLRRGLRRGLEGPENQ